MNEIDRYRGSLLGLAAGDALGTTVEFEPPGSFEPVNNLIGGGPFNLRPGEWTDDTSMALCLAASLVERGNFDAADQMQRYVKWWKQGYMSSTSRCFDIGITVREALAHFLQTANPYAGKHTIREIICRHSEGRQQSFRYDSACLIIRVLKCSNPQV